MQAMCSVKKDYIVQPLLQPGVSKEDRNQNAVSDFQEGHAIGADLAGMDILFVLPSASCCQHGMWRQWLELQQPSWPVR